MLDISAALIWAYIHQGLILYSSETLKYGQLKAIQKKILEDLQVANYWQN